MQFDIIIIGGGMVGAAMASALQSSFKIALIDSTPLTPATDHRLIALTYSSVCFFKNLGLWNALSPYASAIKEIHVSHRNHFGITRLQAAELQLAQLGFVVPAIHINNVLNEQLNNVTIFRPATLHQLTQTADCATITITTPQGSQSLTAKFIIGADGSHSTVRKLLDIQTQTIDYHQSALVTTTQLQRSHQHVAYERFQANGAIAMLPLPNENVATIWTDSQDNINALLNLSDADFLARLQQQFGYRLGRLKKTSQRYTYPLQMIQADQKVKERVILIGNAAHTLHPIAAQGLNLALYEIATLADYFSLHDVEQISLSEFATQQQKISTQLSHQLTGLFSQDFFMLNLARPIAMVGLDLCKTLKRRFLQSAIGQAGKVPELLRENEL